MDTLFGLIMVLVVLFMYFIPTVVGYVRGCVAIKKIALINLLAGWTFIGWVVAAMMAYGGRQKAVRGA